jgi:DNA primase
MTDNHSLLNRLLERPMQTAAEYYARHLSDAAHNFLDKHCLSADSQLAVGFSDRTLGKQLPSKTLKAGHLMRQQLQQCGILKASGHEALRGFVTVPLTDSAGLISGIYALRIDCKGKDQPQITLGQGIFNAQALTGFDEIIVCATVLDAWALHAAGHTNAIACDGQSLKIEDFTNVKRVLLANPDIDCVSLGDVELMQIHLPEGTSVHQYAMLNRNIPSALGNRIRAATVVETAKASGPPEPAPTPKLSANSNSKPTAKPTNDTTDQPRTPSASPLPAPVDDIGVTQTDTETTLRIESRRWRVRGLERNTTAGIMRVNLLIFNERNQRFHVDTLDLYHSRSRRVYLKEAAEETALSEHELRSDLGRVLLKLEELQEQQRTRISRNALASGSFELTEAQRSAAMELLQDENLLDRILDDFQACGIVGERTGKLVGYLAATSRLLHKPLGLIIQSSSAAGKSSLADAVLRFMPPEECFSCSAMTSQSLYYLGNENLQHKILSVAEEEGVRNAAYQLKILQSEGRLSLVATSKESGTGRTATQRYEVEGPVALMMTTTALDVDPELLNRCLVVNVDESPQQTQAIHQLQRQARTLAGILQAGQHEQLQTLHHNAQRLLRPLVIVNPYAEQLKFIGNQARHRRDHVKYLTLIEAVALLHQHQRKIQRAQINGQDTDYIEVTRRDIALANTIADWALGRSIDELTGPTRRLLIALYDWLRDEAKQQNIDFSEITFTRRQAREAIGWSATPMRIHLERLCRHEYVVTNGGGGHGQLCRYSLLYDGRGREGQPSLVGLVDPAELSDPVSMTTTPKLIGQIAS